MSASPATDRLAAVALFGLALGARLPLILAHPAVYGGDSVARLARSDELLLAYQLPLPQLVVFALRALHPDPLLTRLGFACIGALVPLALARALLPALGARPAWSAGVLAALHPLPLYYSLVPYQESPMLLLLLLGAAALRSGRDGAASLWLGLACLCRYEAWIAAALAAFSRRRRPLFALLRFGWAPMLWMLAWGGLSPAGTYVLDLDAEASRLTRLVFLLGKLREYSGWTALALALIGAGFAWRGRSRALAWAAAYLGAFLAAVVGAGHEFPPGSGQVSERLAHVPALAVCALAGLGLASAAQLVSRGRAALARSALALAVLAQGQAWVRSARDLVREANRDPSLVLALEVARLGESQLRAGERLAVAAPRVPEAALEDYVRKVERSGGDAARARAIALGLARHSPDADRIAANLARPPGSVVADPARAALIAIFDDAPEPPAPAGPVVARFQAGPRGVTVYRSSSR